MLLTLPILDFTGPGANSNTCSRKALSIPSWLKSRTSSYALVPLGWLMWRSAQPPEGTFSEVYTKNPTGLLPGTAAMLSAERSLQSAGRST